MSGQSGQVTLETAVEYVRVGLNWPAQLGVTTRRPFGRKAEQRSWAGQGRLNRACSAFTQRVSELEAKKRSKIRRL